MHGWGCHAGDHTMGTTLHGANGMTAASDSAIQDPRSRAEEIQTRQELLES